MELIQPFSYCFGSKVIEEDLSELKDNTLFANGKDQQHLPEEVRNPFLILNEYPHSKKIITEYFNNFIRNNFSYSNDGFKVIDFSMTTSWMTKLSKGEKVHFHNHVNSMWSGVFYFDEYTDADVGLTFQNPISKTFIFQIGQSKWNPMGKDVTVQPEHNLLIFFPSHINHYSIESNQSETRRSLAFNFMPNEMVGEGDSSYDPAWMR